MDNSCDIQKRRELNKKFKLIAFDWDGTAVRDRASDTSDLAKLLENLLEKDVIICIITGTNVNNIHRQLVNKIKNYYRAKLFICANRGSEVYGYNQVGEIVMLYRRDATPSENTALNKVAEETIEEVLKSSRFKINITYNRLNRRKLDLIPEWDDPKKEEVEILRRETFERFKYYGFKENIHGVKDIILRVAQKYEFKNLKITSDVKHIEIGLTDKSDSIKWILDNITKINDIKDSEILIAGDEFSPVDEIEGSDYKMVLPEHNDITYASFGIEPEGVPDPVIFIGDGPECFFKYLEKQRMITYEL